VASFKDATCAQHATSTHYSSYIKACTLQFVCLVHAPETKMTNGNLRHKKEFKIGLQHCTVKVRCFGEGQVHTSGWVCDCVWCGVCQPALDGSLRWPAHGAASSASAAGSHGYDRDHSVRRRRVSDCHTHTHKQHTHTQTATQFSHTVLITQPPPFPSSPTDHTSPSQPRTNTPI
jgi:hypothetical protein